MAQHTILVHNNATMQQRNDTYSQPAAISSGASLSSLPPATAAGNHSFIRAKGRLQVFAPQGIYAVPMKHIRGCEMAQWSHERKRSEQTLFSTSEWNSLGDELRSGKGSIHDGTSIPCNETDRMRLSDADMNRIINASTIAFAILVRDAVGFLARNLRITMTLGEAFRRYWIFYTENDSVDGSKRILSELTQRHPQIFRGELRDKVAANTSTGMCKGSDRNCFKRIDFLANLRQRVFDMAMAHGGWDALVMLDLDFLQVSSHHFWQAVAIGVRLRAAAVFGQSVQRNLKGHCLLYDTGAYVYSWRTDMSKKAMTFRNPVLKKMNKGCVGLVQSGHGGFPILYAGGLAAANPKPRYAGHNWSAWGSRVVDLVPFNVMLARATMNISLPLHERRPLFAYSRFRPLYTWGESGTEDGNYDAALWWKERR